MTLGGKQSGGDNNTDAHHVKGTTQTKKKGTAQTKRSEKDRNKTTRQGSASGSAGSDRLTSPKSPAPELGLESPLSKSPGHQRNQRLNESWRETINKDVEPSVCTLDLVGALQRFTHYVLPMDIPGRHKTNTPNCFLREFSGSSGTPGPLGISPASRRKSWSGGDGDLEQPSRCSLASPLPRMSRAASAVVSQQQQHQHQHQQDERVLSMSLNADRPLMLNDRPLTLNDIKDLINHTGAMPPQYIKTQRVFLFSKCEDVREVCSLLRMYEPVLTGGESHRLYLLWCISSPGYDEKAPVHLVVFLLYELQLHGREAGNMSRSWFIENFMTPEKFPEIGKLTVSHAFWTWMEQCRFNYIYPPPQLTVYLRSKMHEDLFKRMFA